MKVAGTGCQTCFSISANVLELKHQGPAGFGASLVPVDAFCSSIFFSPAASFEFVKRGRAELPLEGASPRGPRVTGTSGASAVSASDGNAATGVAATSFKDSSEIRHKMKNRRKF